MKQIIILIALILATTLAADAQVRGTYGTYQPFGTSTMSIWKYTNGVPVAVAAGKLDTLTNVDTGLVRTSFQSNMGFIFDFAVTKISGTVAGTALLQGSLDNSTWQTLTGATAVCAGCQGASATITNTAGTKHYTWIVPANSTSYPYYQVQAITSGTCTASYTGSASYKY